VIVCVGAVAASLYLRHLRRPLPSASSGAAPELLSELPSDAPAVAYIDVAALRKLQNSPLSSLLGLTSPSAQAEKEYAEFVRATGFDYSRDLDQAAIASWPTGLSVAANAAGNNPALAVADGRFDQQKIEAYAIRAGGKPEKAGDYKRYVVPGYPPVAFEFLSASRIAIASGKTSADLLNRLKTEGAPDEDPATQERVRRVAGAPIFGIVRTDQLPKSFYANFEGSPQLNKFVRSIRGLSLAGQPKDDQIHVALDAECDSMTNAIQISTLLDGFRLVGAMALSDPKTRAQLQMTPEQIALLQAFVKEAQVTHQDRWVRISLDVTPAMLGVNQRRPSGHSGPGSH
jgi:hypothetical protein